MLTPAFVRSSIAELAHFDLVVAAFEKVGDFSPEAILELAALLGSFSPCQKSKRAVIIWGTVYSRLHVIGWGINAPPSPFVCDGSPGCRAACGRVCVHAETAAVLHAGEWMAQAGVSEPAEVLQRAELLHLKVEDGQAVPSGGPSCERCSAVILHAGLAGVHLFHADGLRRYPAEEFHRLSMLANNCPTTMGS